MAARPMDPAVGGATPGGVVGLSLSFSPQCNSAVVLVGGAVLLEWPYLLRLATTDLRFFTSP